MRDGEGESSSAGREIFALFAFFAVEIVSQLIFRLDCGSASRYQWPRLVEAINQQETC
jgi:hypothetical protein